MSYSTSLDHFSETVVDLFNRAIAATQQVPNLEKFILQKLFWRDDVLLESVGSREPWVCKLRQSIKFVLCEKYF